MSILSDANRYHILKLLEQNAELSQREMAQKLNLSLGKVNYCLNALIDKGLVKASNFKNSNNKVSYSYFLTRKGLKEKAGVTIRFLEQKKIEYDSLSKEIEELRVEVGLLSRPFYG